MTTIPTPSNAPELIVRTEDNVRVLILNRPERRNALSRALKAALSAAILDVEADNEIRVIVISGAGDVFCAGADLKEMHREHEAGRRSTAPNDSTERSVYEIVYETKKPTIAALNGSAVAGGFELALACDIRITHAGAQFGLPETKIGLGATFGSVVLPRRVAPGIALEMLYTGEYIDAARALQVGLLNHVVEVGQVFEQAMALARQIAANAPISVRRVKAMALRGLDMPVATALRQDPGLSPYYSEDRKEGVRARQEKRPPVWKNR